MALIGHEWTVKREQDNIQTEWWFKVYYSAQYGVCAYNRWRDWFHVSNQSKIVWNIGDSTYIGTLDMKWVSFISYIYIYIYKIYKKLLNLKPHA